MTRRFRGVKTMNLASCSAATWKWTFERFTTAAVVVSVRTKSWVANWRPICFTAAAFSFFFATQRLDAANCAAGSPGLVGWWPGDGNARDIAGTNNGSLQGGASATTPGVVGSAFSFDGTNAYVQVPDSAVFHPTNLTIECWVRFASLDSAGSGGSPAGDQYIVFKQNSLSGNFEGFDLSKTRAGNDFFRFMVSFSKGTVQVLSATAISTGAWYHVAAVRGSNSISLYVNGQLEGQTSVSFPQDYGTLPLYFGTSGQSYWDHKLKGNLDEISLYNRALNSNEILAIYTAGAAGKCRIAPSITTGPQDASALWGSALTFSALATGTSPLRYQWQKDGAPLTGATNSALSLTNIQSGNAGLYNVIVTNAFGAATSQTARLTFKVANLSMAKAGGPAPNLPGVNISGVAGELYGIQICSNLAPPVNWVGLTNVLLPQANYTWFDPSPAKQQRFYRVVPGPTSIGSSAWETSPVGAVVFDDFNRSALGSNYVILSGANVSVSSNQLFFNQTDVNYSRQIYFQPWQTCSDEWTIRWSQRFATLDANSRGVGVGLKNFQTFGGNDRGYNGLLCGAGADLGKMQIQRFDGSSQVFVGSGAAMSLGAGDIVDCSLTRSGWTLTASATNRANSQSSAVAISLNTAPAAFAPTISRLCFYPLSGAVWLDDFSFTINHRKPARFIVIGGSSSDGYNASTHERAFVNVIQTNFVETVCNDSSCYNTVADSLSALPEILAQQPGTAVLLIGGNDVYFGVPAAQWQQNYSNLVAQLWARGVKVKHCAVPRNTADLSGLRNWIANSYPAYDIIDTWTPLGGGSSRLNSAYDSGDGVHPNDAGHLLIGQIIRTNLP
jgi:lysophospholipase L1-like esterase